MVGRAFTNIVCSVSHDSIYDTDVPIRYKVFFTVSKAVKQDAFET